RPPARAARPRIGPRSRDRLRALGEGGGSEHCYFGSGSPASGTGGDGSATGVGLVSAASGTGGISPPRVVCWVRVKEREKPSTFAPSSASPSKVCVTEAPPPRRLPSAIVTSPETCSTPPFLHASGFAGLGRGSPES